MGVSGEAARVQDQRQGAAQSAAWGYHEDGRARCTLCSWSGSDRTHRRELGHSLHGVHAHEDVRLGGHEEVDECARGIISRNVEEAAISSI